MTRKRILIIVIVLLAAGGGAAYYGWSEFNRKNKSTSELEPVADFSSDSLALKFEENDSTATVELGGKIIRLTGVIEESNMEQGVLRLRLRGSDLSGIICQMEAVDSSQLANYRVGATVCLKGKCNAYQKVDMLPGGDLLVNNCVFINYK